MRNDMDNGLCEVVYENKRYDNLEFIRLDRISQKSYITLKNVLTGEMYTFDEGKIHGIEKAKGFPISTNIGDSDIKVAL